MLEYLLTSEQKETQRLEQENKTKENRMELFRKRRNEKLAECDWTVLPDSPLSAEERIVWATYRQALRDVPSTVNSDGWVIWPKKPK